MNDWSAPFPPAPLTQTRSWTLDLHPAGVSGWPHVRRPTHHAASRPPQPQCSSHRIEHLCALPFRPQWKLLLCKPPTLTPTFWGFWGVTAGHLPHFSPATQVGSKPASFPLWHFVNASVSNWIYAVFFLSLHPLEFSVIPYVLSSLSSLETLTSRLQ